jgi:hypothetical protein
MVQGVESRKTGCTLRPIGRPMLVDELMPLHGFSVRANRECSLRRKARQAGGFNRVSRMGWFGSELRNELPLC